MVNVVLLLLLAVTFLTIANTNTIDDNYNDEMDSNELKRLEDCCICPGASISPVIISDGRKKTQQHDKNMESRTARDARSRKMYLQKKISPADETLHEIIRFMRRLGY